MFTFETTHSNCKIRLNTFGPKYCIRKAWKVLLPKNLLYQQANMIAKISHCPHELHCKRPEQMPQSQFLDVSLPACPLNISSKPPKTDNNMQIVTLDVLKCYILSNILQKGGQFSSCAELIELFRCI